MRLHEDRGLGTVGPMDRPAASADVARHPEAGAPPLVDVVLPTYGGGPHLAKAIASVVAQTYPSWRLTVVDNSPHLPATAEAVAAHAADRRVHRVVTGGLSQAENWNAALGCGTAPYVAMIHDDDTWDPTFLARRVEALESHPRCAFAFSGYRQIDGADRETALRPAPLSGGCHEPRDFVPVLYADNIIAVSAVLYRRAALDAVGPTFHEPARYFDYELWLRLAAHFPVHHVDAVDNGGRVHDQSVTTAHATADERQAGRMWLEFLDVVDPMLDRAAPGLVHEGLRRRRRAGALLTCTLDELQAGRRRQAVRHLRSALRTDPASVLDPRVPVAALLLAAGPRALPVLARARNLQHVRQIPVHVSDLRARGRELRHARRLSQPAG